VLPTPAAGVFDREARRAASRWRFAARREKMAQAARVEATKTLYFPAWMEAADASFTRR